MVPETTLRSCVDKEVHTWKEGEGMLIVDVRRPMGPLSDAVNRLSLRSKRKWSSQFLKMPGDDI